MKSKLIFFVDDDKVINNLMEYTFKSRDNYEVRTYSRGEDCIQNLGLKPDLIVLDFHFNKNVHARLNGLETLKEIVDHDKNIPVFMLTNQDDNDTIEELLQTGARRFIAKDAYFIDELIDAIEKELSE